MLILIFNYYSLNLLTTAFLFLSLKDKDSRIDSLEKELKESRGTITKLQTEVASLNRELCDIARYDGGGGGGYGGGYGRGAKKTPAKRTAQEEADLAQVKSEIKMNEIAFRKKLDVEVKAEQEANQSRAWLNNMHQVNAMAQQVGAQNFMQQQLQNNAMFGMVGSGGGGLSSQNNFQQMGMMQSLAGTYNGPFGNPVSTALRGWGLLNNMHHNAATATGLDDAVFGNATTLSTSTGTSTAAKHRLCRATPEA